ncbi:hypothetical protein [Pantoea stewartii]|uniref:hypothetical protein n=1 Tax=Pantoea stewartii TaxID=66269 RepID=UPI0007364371|nr:hypothetical protein [Pantoea stewartii]
MLSSDTLCALTGASLTNVRRWQRYGLVAVDPVTDYWTEAQLEEIREVMSANAHGATAQEMHDGRRQSEGVMTYGWPARRGEILNSLEFGSDRQLIRVIRSLSRDFAGDDFVRSLMRPLCSWLREDQRRGAARRLARFEHVTEHHHACVTRAASRSASVPLLLEIAGEVQNTDVLLEAIGLTAQGFSVDVCVDTSVPLPAHQRKSYDHHLIWQASQISVQ